MSKQIINKCIYIIEDDSTDFEQIKKILHSRNIIGYKIQTNDYDKDFYKYFRIFCDRNSTYSQMIESKEYILKALNFFKNIDLFILDFELFENSVDYCNSIEFMKNFIKDSDVLKKVPIHGVSKETGDFHNELVNDWKISYDKKNEGWKSNDKPGKDFSKFFLKNVDDKLFSLQQVEDVNVEKSLDESVIDKLNENIPSPTAAVNNDFILTQTIELTSVIVKKIQDKELIVTNNVLDNLCKVYSDEDYFELLKKINNS